jgi:methylmalonyl-CoA/ethylmalonyl-CoA epimerase
MVALSGMANSPRYQVARIVPEDAQPPECSKSLREHPPVAEPFSLSVIGQIAVRAIDLDRAVAFYRDVLGMRFLFQAPPGLAFFDCAGVRLLIDKPEAEFDHPSSVIYYRVPDIHQAHASLVARGVQFRAEPQLIAKMPDHDLWMAFFDDTEGNTLALMSEVRPPGAA